MLILMGEDDDWTPAPPCHELAARFPDEITFVAYPGAYHDFDAPDRPVKVRTGAVSTPSGLAHVGTNDLRVRTRWNACRSGWRRRGKSRIAVLR